MEPVRHAREISNLNFEEEFPKIKEALESASFIAFDAEFTGMSTLEVKQNSLFDTPEERYATMRDNLKEFIMSQFGLTTFQHDRHANKYTANTFVFYLFPRSVGALSRQFNAETSAFEFLSKFAFDFNKLMGSGVSYLSTKEARSVSDLTLLRGGVPALRSAMGARRNGPVGGAPLPSNAELAAAAAELLALRAWLDNAAAAAGDDLLRGTVCSASQPLMDRLKEAVDTLFPTVLVTTGLDPVTGKMCNVYQDISADPEKFRLRLKNEALGFARVFHLLVELGKPIVGHNPILDLMLLYNQFHQPLPERYDTFKRDLHKLLPAVLDTKFLSYELRDRLRWSNGAAACWDSNELGLLHAYLETGAGARLAKSSPGVHLANRPEGQASACQHEAGWDSFLTGVCFLRMMHVFASQNNLGFGMEAKALTSAQHLFSVREYVNHINISRANVSHINLSGKDPPSGKPRWLVVSLTDKRALRRGEICQIVAAHTDLSLDVKHLSTTQALVAVNSASAVRDLRQAFANETDFSVSGYNPLKHNRLLRCWLWAGIVGSSGLATALFALGRHSWRL